MYIVAFAKEKYIDLNNFDSDDLDDYKKQAKNIPTAQVRSTQCRANAAPALSKRHFSMLKAN